MTGFTDGDQFAQGMKGGGENILCMEQTYGIVGCPRCAKAKALYAQADERGESREKEGPFRKEAKGQYHKKVYFGLGIVSAHGKPQNGNICLCNIPTQQVEFIVGSVMHKNPDARWPNPADLLHGRAVIFDKSEKNDGSGYAQYSTKLAHSEYPLTQEWWDSVRHSLPSLDDPAAVQVVLDSWNAANIFSPYSDMQKGESVSVRLLPHTARPGATPFIQMKVHFATAPNPWEKAWRDVNYDPARSAEVLANPQVVTYLGVVGGQGFASQQGMSGDYAGTPAPGMPQVGGVTLPGLPGSARGFGTGTGPAGMDDLPKGY